MKNRKIRITLDLNENAYERLKKLTDLVGAANKASVIRDSLQLYEFVAHRTAEGSSMRMVSKEGDESEVVIFGTSLPLKSRVS